MKIVIGLCEIVTSFKILMRRAFMGNVPENYYTFKLHAMIDIFSNPNIIIIQFFILYQYHNDKSKFFSEFCFRFCFFQMRMHQLKILTSFVIMLFRFVIDFLTAFHECVVFYSNNLVFVRQYNLKYTIFASLVIFIFYF